MSRTEVDRLSIKRDLVDIMERAGSVSVPVRLPARAVTRLVSKVGAQVAEDLQVFARRDAAARDDQVYIYSSYLSFQAVMAHRLANALCGLRVPGIRPDLLVAQARRVSEHFRLTTGVEIHPGATIGRRFVIDHGSGTVVGEQAKIGDDCYFVQNVVLGARDLVSRNGGRAQPRRHPTIGNRVQVGGDVHVFGPVRVGDDCLIESGARITSDVPAGSRVRIISTVQVSLSDRSPVVHGLACVDGRVVITGSGLDGLRPAFLDQDRRPLASLAVLTASDTEIHCTPGERTRDRPRAIGLLRGHQPVCYIEPSAHVLTALVDRKVMHDVS